MTDAQSPSNVPATTAATKPQTAETTVECRECRWPVVEDLNQVWVLGYPVTLCRNVWQCWFRQQDLDEHLTPGG